MNDVYGFRGGPSFSAARREDLFASAMERPMSLGSTFWDQAKGGVLESFGLGTAVRTLMTPPLASDRRGRETEEQYQARQATRMNEDDYKSSPYYRQSIPWDDGMTEDRAAALAVMSDAKAVRDFYAQKRPITSFFGGLAGQAVDPVNYIPVAGPAVKAAAVARMGLVKGAVATAALDAAANTAIAGLATRETRRSFGDDVSWEAMVSEIATAALIGSAFGTVGGLLERRAGARAATVRQETEQRLSTLKTVQESRVALNEAIGGLANDGEIRLSPNATEPMARVAADIEAPTKAGDIAPLIENDAESVRADAFTDVAEPFRSLRDDPEARGLTTDMSAVRIKGQVFSAETHEEAIREAVARLDEATVEREIEADPEGTLGHVAPRPKPLPHDSSLNRTASWVIRDKATGKAVMETFNPSLVERVNTAKYEAVPIGQYLGEINGQPKQRPTVDASPPRRDPIPEGRIEAETRTARPDDYKALASQYRVDPETGKFDEEAELSQLETEGRLTESDAADMEAADETYQDSAAYGKALKTAVNCLL